MLSRPGCLCKVCLVVLNFDIFHQLSDQPWKISFETKCVFTQYFSNLHAYELNNIANFCLLHEFENTYNQNSSLSSYLTFVHVFIYVRMFCVFHYTLYIQSSLFLEIVGLFHRSSITCNFDPLSVDT